MEHNFLTELVSEPTRYSAPLDFFLFNREAPVGDVKVAGYPGHSSEAVLKGKGVQKGHFKKEVLKA